MNARAIAAWVGTCVVLTCAQAHAYGTLIGQVRSDAVPTVEFDTIRVEIELHGDPADVLVFDHAADPGRSYDAGERILEEPCFPSGRHLATFSLLRGDVVLAQRPVRFIVPGLDDLGFEPPFPNPYGGCYPHSGVEVITVLLTQNPRPCDSDDQCRDDEWCEEEFCELRPFIPVEPLKLVALDDDVDGSGSITPGDVLRYSVAFYSSHTLLRGSFLEDEPSGAALLPGTVTTSHGVVFRGNFPWDTDVRVNFGLVPFGETVAVTFKAVVTPVVSNQARLTILDEDGYAYPAVTDDPSTDPSPDPTVVSVQCGAPQDPQCQQCLGALDACVDERDALGEENAALAQEVSGLEAQLTELRKELDALAGDDDGDGVANVRDDCADTAAAAAVDAAGCSLAQFCGAVDVEQTRWRRVCRRADWQGDEPLGGPRDCRPRRRPNRCVPR